MIVSSMLFMLAFWCGMVPILEQPLNSVMPRCNPLAGCFSFVDAARVVTWHNAYGASSPKPFQLYSPSRMITCLKRKKAKADGTTSSLCRYTWKGGRKQVTGIKGLMHESQAYTLEFGVAVGGMMKDHLDALAATT